MDRRRRQLLATVGTAGLLAGCVGVGFSDVRQASRKRAQSADAALHREGRAELSEPGEYAQGSIGPEGRFGVVATKDGSGSFLVDLDDPAEPTERHHLSADYDEGFDSGDAKFDPRGGLYYRTREPAESDEGRSGGGTGGVEIVDFGFNEGSPEEPQIVGRMDSPFTHNVHPHPEVPLVYATNTASNVEEGVEVWDVGEPADPEHVATAWPHGPLHDVVADPIRDLLHCASGKGYAALDISEPESPTELGRVQYSEREDYTEIGEPGFEHGHYANYDPGRDLVVMGDEVTEGIPGGKHVIDIGWDEGTVEDPKPIGFTHSPNAEVQDSSTDGFWTTHNHDVYSRGGRTFAVSGDYNEGVVLYDITDPRDPTPVDRYPTDDGADDLEEGSRAPSAWSAMYSPERDLIFAADIVTGAYTFRQE